MDGDVGRGSGWDPASGELWATSSGSHFSDGLVEVEQRLGRGWIRAGERMVPSGIRGSGEDGYEQGMKKLQRLGPAGPQQRKRFKTTAALITEVGSEIEVGLETALILC